MQMNLKLQLSFQEVPEDVSWSTTQVSKNCHSKREKRLLVGTVNYFGIVYGHVFRKNCSQMGQAGKRCSKMKLSKKTK